MLEIAATFTSQARVPSHAGGGGPEGSREGHRISETVVARNRRGRRNSLVPEPFARRWPGSLAPGRARTILDGPGHCGRSTNFFAGRRTKPGCPGRKGSSDYDLCSAAELRGTTNEASRGRRGGGRGAGPELGLAATSVGEIGGFPPGTWKPRRTSNRMDRRSDRLGRLCKAPRALTIPRSAPSRRIVSYSVEPRVARTRAGSTYSSPGTPDALRVPRLEPQVAWCHEIRSLLGDLRARHG